MTLVDPQNDFLSHTKLQLYTRRIKILNQKNDNCTATQKNGKFYGWGAKLEENCVQFLDLLGLLSLLGLLGLLSH